MRNTLAVFVVLTLFTPLIHAENPVREKPENSDTPPDQSVTSITPSRPAHPAFVLSPEIVRAATARGESLAKKGKKWEDIQKDFKKSRKTPKWAFKKGKEVKNCSVFFRSLDALPVIEASYQSTVQNKTNTLPDGLLDKNYTLTNLEFEVSLRSDPVVQPFTEYWDTGFRPASAKAVQAVAFTLLDDKGNIFKATSGSTIGKSSTGLKKLRNAQKHPVFDKIKISTQYLPYYCEAYKVVFPMFDALGEPIISTDVKKITLNIHTPELSLCAEYDLKPLVFK